MFFHTDILDRKLNRMRVLVEEAHAPVASGFGDPVKRHHYSRNDSSHPRQSLIALSMFAISDGAGSRVVGRLKDEWVSRDGHG
jgi:hypothetical protein